MLLPPDLKTGSPVKSVSNQQKAPIWKSLSYMFAKEIVVTGLGKRCYFQIMTFEKVLHAHCGYNHMLGCPTENVAHFQQPLGDKHDLLYVL